ncbi:hypothetical protein BGW36DRAFT_390575 [Talaromyces proteolyticus]|uniref:Zn(2)-C6 fungal-type domain-containing protein n=1 Tax=Talaromyces proteolyticus TaxID=1131652 RepID=A0AAD4KG40_9EURO|nr:uncharacterized protein BGW36DRAFT_390575 [Talaromyces proteolyticus]KAH8690308.1 hypothetical protein BGW36DRAFT_390575 [Talaromyces proteolyticus]
MTQPTRHRPIPCAASNIQSSGANDFSAARHLKCDGNKPICERCERTGVSCIWGQTRIRFRHGSSARYDADFADDQPWLKSDGHVNYKYVDETADIASCYTVDSIQEPPTWSAVRNRSVSSVSDYHPPTDSSPPCGILEESPLTFDFATSSSSRRRRVHEDPNHESFSFQLSPHDGQSINSSPLNPSHPSHQSLRPTDNISQIDNRLMQAPQSSFDAQEACLIRYFIVELAHWTLCYNSSITGHVIPPLMNAIYTTSARHLSRIRKYYMGDEIHYQGKVLPDLKPETALYYHNRCIEHLVSLSDDPLETKDEDLLAAAVILRFYEEVDVPFTGDDIENALSGIQVFLDAEAISTAAGSSLRRAAYWVALRQETITAFSKQRPFRLPLEPCETYRSFEPADDYVWANRLVLHCADVLQYCFGTEQETANNRDRAKYTTITPGIVLPVTSPENFAGADMTPAHRLARYEELVTFDNLWTELGPSSFNAIHSREPDRSRGEVFPEYWCLNDCHVTGIQHLELARILLAVYNPGIPRMGPYHRLAMQLLDKDVKSTILRLCGLALSNQHSPPGLITASVAIAMCGDRFTDVLEQKALLGVLMKLEDEYGWPTVGTRDTLKKAWGWKDGL